jgi:hypothetical protein
MATPLLTKYFNTYNFDKNGTLQLTSIVDISTYSKVNVDVYGQSPAGHTVEVQVNMGVLGGATLGSTVLQFPLITPSAIHTLDVVGPQMSVLLVGGPPNGSIALEAWTFFQ